MQIGDGFAIAIDGKTVATITLHKKRSGNRLMIALSAPDHVRFHRMRKTKSA